MIDLDAARVARQEATRTAPQIKLNGTTYDLPIEMPFGVLESLAGMTEADTAAVSTARLAKELLGDHFETVRSMLSVDDFNVLVRGVMEEYGVTSPLASTPS